MNKLTVEVQNETLELLPQRAIYWPSKKTLIVSDLHLGKAGHFRKHGIAIPGKIHRDDINILGAIIQSHEIEEIILLGDLFHSQMNNEWGHFEQLLATFNDIQFTLIEGNHDILEEYPDSLIVVKKLDKPPFSFTHIYEEDSSYNLSGHIHPGVSVKGRARQGLTVPCFVFAEDHGVLPAFGQFTGIKRIKPKNNDRIYGIAKDRVIELIP